MSAYRPSSLRPFSSSYNDLQYRAPSRASIDLESAGLHRPHSASSAANLLDNGDDMSTIQGLVSRPSSSLTRYEVYAQLSQSAGYVNSASTSSSFALASLFERLNTGGQLTSHSLDQRIQKLIKLEKKVMKQQQELIKDINSWCNILPSEDCKRLLYHYIKILEVEFDINEQSIKKQSQIIGQLSNVNKREKRTNDLRWKRNKILSKLRESENKVGDSPVTLLTKENLEELECSVEIVEDQFIRSINTGLKNALVDYVMTLRNSGVKYKEGSKYFLDTYNFHNKDVNSASTLQKLILLNKYNGMNSASLPTGQEIHSGYGKGKYPESEYGGENLVGVTDGEGQAKERRTDTPSSPSVLKTDDKKDDKDVSADQSAEGEHMPGSIESYSIINSYSTPGALGMLPSHGSAGHQWGS